MLGLDESVLGVEEDSPADKGSGAAIWAGEDMFGEVGVESGERERVK